MNNSNDTKNLSVELLESKFSSNETKRKNRTVWYRPSQRYVVTFLAFLGLCNMYLLRTNISIALVEMTTSKNVTINGTTYRTEPDFAWTTRETVFILGAHSYGTLFAPIGGLIATKYGGATTFGFGIGLSALITVFIPYIVRFSYLTYAVARTIQGFLEGASVASITALVLNWSTPETRSRMSEFMAAGVFCGAALNYPLSGNIAHLFNWEAIFYTTGFIALIWTSIWFVCVTNEPKDNEKAKCKMTTRNESLSSCPWGRILTSKPVLAYVNEWFVNALSFSFVIYCFPKYIKDVHDMDIQNIGFVTSIPSVCSGVSHLVSAFGIDYLRSHRIISVSNMYKICITLAQLIVIGLLLVIATSSSFVLTVVCLSMFRFVYSIAEVCYDVLLLDMAPRWASLIRGLGLSCSSIGDMLSLTAIGFIVPNRTLGEWQKYFFFLVICNAYGAIMFVAFGSSKLQPWAALPDKNQNISAEDYHLKNTSHKGLTDDETDFVSYA